MGQTVAPDTLNPKIMGSWPLIFSSNSKTADAVRRAVLKGEIVKIGPHLYSSDVNSAKANPGAVIRRNLLLVLEALVPGGVISDRSAATPGFLVKDTVFMVSKRGEKFLELPGLKIQVRQGKGAIEGDTKFGSTNLYLASHARTLLENQIPSRKRGLVSSRLSANEQEEYLERLLRTQGSKSVERIADNLPSITKDLDLGIYGEQALKLARSFLGTVQISPQSKVLKARQHGSPYDPERLNLFSNFAQDLLQHEHQVRRARPEAALQELPFFESYFSNFIEGTEFVIDEARNIVADGTIPQTRSNDAHDILSTYELVSDWKNMRRVPKSPDDFEGILRERHARLMAYRPEMRPGMFKESANRVGLRQFVDPSLVQGTLRQAYRIGDILLDTWSRAVYLGFVVVEVHPFDDGNGRLSRIMINSELTSGNEERLIIPTVFRDNYLSSLRALSSGNGSTAFLRSLEYAQLYTSRVSWRNYETARKTLERTNAFLTDKEAEETGVRLALPQEGIGI